MKLIHISIGSFVFWGALLLVLLLNLCFEFGFELDWYTYFVENDISTKRPASITILKVSLFILLILISAPINPTIKGLKVSFYTLLTLMNFFVVGAYFFTTSDRLIIFLISIVMLILNYILNLACISEYGRMTEIITLGDLDNKNTYDWLANIVDLLFVMIVIFL